ncbi:MAG: sulfotransferase [Prolixibacteraceae bacterium]|nr:sulfotransferase [Prolixibacteraceae bacterium]MBN2648943.1 sulfotransferase [Prolixibacteraceae bacterium]
MTNKNPILVTGIIRSGTTWVGRVLATCEDTIYIHEPMNPQSPWNSCFPTPVIHYHLNEKNGGPYKNLFTRLIKLDPVLRGEWKNTIAENRKKYIYNNTKKFKNPQTIIKDPTALYSANWINNYSKNKVVFVLRHPISIIKSLLKLDWAKNLNFESIKNQVMLMDYFYSNLSEKDNQIINSNWNNFSDVEKAVFSVRFLYLAVCKYYTENNEYIYISYENFSNNPYDNFLNLFEKLELKPSNKTINDLQSTTTYNTAKKHQNTSIPIKPDIDKIFNSEYGLTDPKEIFHNHFLDIYDTLKNVVSWE